MNSENSETNLEISERNSESSLKELMKTNRIWISGANQVAEIKDIIKNETPYSLYNKEHC